MDMEKENKHSRGKIYKIVCGETGEVYYGSTCEPTVARRLTTHVQHYRLWKKGKNDFVTSYPIIDRNNYNIYLVENFPCDTRDQLKAREGWYQLNNACVNKHVAGQTIKQWYKVNKTQLAEKHAIYYTENKTQLAEKKAIYYTENKTQKLEYQSQYNVKNKIHLTEKNTCACGGKHTTGHKSKHSKTKLHQTYITNLPIIQPPTLTEDTHTTNNIL